MAATLEGLGVSLTIVKRNGSDGATIPGAALALRSCVFGFGADADVRIMLNGVADKECKIMLDNYDHIYLEPLVDRR